MGFIDDFRFFFPCINHIYKMWSVIFSLARELDDCKAVLIVEFLYILMVYMGISFKSKMVKNI